MKTIEIKTRTIKERTGYKKYPFKDVFQFKVTFENVEIFNAQVDEKNLKKKFDVFKTRSKKKLIDYISRLGRMDGEKELKKILMRIYEKGQKNEILSN